MAPPKKITDPSAPRRRHRPYVRREKPDTFLAIPNRSTRDGKRLRKMRADLIRHVGGAPNAVQSILIDRVIMLTWQSIQLDRLAATASGQEAIDILERAEKLANTLGRALGRLGLKGAPPPAPSIAALDWSAVRTSARTSAAA